MAYRVSWSPIALTDMKAIATYTEADSPAYARAVVKRIQTATRSLADFPRAGRVVPEFGDETIREVFAYSYRIIYQIRANEVIVAAVVHGHRML